MASVIAATAAVSVLRMRGPSVTASPAISAISSGEMPPSGPIDDRRGRARPDAFRCSARRCMPRASSQGTITSSCSRKARKRLLPAHCGQDFRHARPSALLGRLQRDAGKPLGLLRRFLSLGLCHAPGHRDRNQPARAQLGDLLRNEVQLVRLGQALIQRHANGRLGIGQAVFHANRRFRLSYGRQHRRKTRALAVKHARPRPPRAGEAP